jgi:hypothetical protein
MAWQSPAAACWPIDLPLRPPCAHALPGIIVVPEWRDAVKLHLRITRNMAQRAIDFALSDEADAAPVFHAWRNSPGARRNRLPPR